MGHKSLIQKCKSSVYRYPAVAGIVRKQGYVSHIFTVKRNKMEVEYS